MTINLYLQTLAKLVQALTFFPFFGQNVNNCTSQCHSRDFFLSPGLLKMPSTMIGLGMVQPLSNGQMRWLKLPPDSLEVVLLPYLVKLEVANDSMNSKSDLVISK